jgi:hypothetical protein
VRGSVHDIVGSMLDFFGLIDDGEVVVPRLRSLRILKVATNRRVLRTCVVCRVSCVVCRVSCVVCRVSCVVCRVCVCVVCCCGVSRRCVVS